MMILKKIPKLKKCKACGQMFEPFKTLQRVCSVECAIVLANIATEKKKQKEARELKAKLKTRADWLREAHAAFNAFIRERDKDLPCISCGSFTGKRNAGHYRSVGACPELRFNEENVHTQCEKCNSWLSGNAIAYRKNLLAKIGQEKLEWLEGKHEPLKLTIEQIKEIKELYKRKLKELKGK